MLRSASSILARRAQLIATSSPSVPVVLAQRSFTTLEHSKKANDAWQKSCYVAIDYTIPEDCTVFEAVQRFSAYKIGCLVTTDGDGNLSGIISERDYVTKIAAKGLNSKETKISEISTKADKLVTATPHDEIGDCMNKILSKDVRHLPLLGDDGKSVVGMISVKDLIKVELEEKQKMIDTLSNFALGKGGHFVED